MTNAEIAKLVAAVTAALSSPKSGKFPPLKKPYKPYVNPRISKADVDVRTDRVMKRRALVAKGFSRRGLKLSFDEATGRFDNVKPFKTWLSEGRIVRRGEHGVKGLFHVSQTMPYVQEVISIPADVVIGQQI